MAPLDEMATAADVGFAETHDGQKRRRGKSNPKRCGAGYSPCTAEAAKDCTRSRQMIKAAWRNDGKRFELYARSWSRTKLTCRW